MTLVNNTYGKCKYCDTRFRLRYQVGFTEIPVYFSCPKCSAVIKGKFSFDSSKIYPQIKNLVLIEGENADYVVEQSSEFLQRKIYKDEKSIDISPFLRTTLLYENLADMQKEFSSLLSVINFKNKDLVFVEDMMDILYSNSSGDVFIKSISNRFSKNNIISKLDAYMQLHQLLILGISPTLKKNMIQGFTEQAKSISELAFKKPKEMNDIIIYFLENNGLNSNEMKLLKIICDFINMIENFIPIIMPAKIDLIDSIDQNIYGISTIGLKELKNFYSYSYEILAKSVDVIILLNNLEYRGEFKKLPDNDTFASFEEFEEKTNKFSKKMEKLLVKEEKYSDSMFELDSIIRNAINHETYEVDVINQQIEFIDKFKGRDRRKKISYLDFANLCYKNFLMAVSILEIIYNIKKIKYITFDQEMLNIKLSK